jgi:TonB family protein
MAVNYYPQRATFGLLPEPERSTASFITSFVINGLILALVLYIGATARHVLQQRQYEQTVLIIPTTPEPPPPPKIKLPEPPKLPDPPKLNNVKLEAPKINVPRPEPKPDVKPIQIESKINLPVIKTPKLAIVEAPQPRAVLSTPMPAQVPQTKVTTAAVHLGQTFGVTPNPNATRPATIAAIGNPYGGMQGAAIAPHGVVGGTGIGNGIKATPSAAIGGKVASAGIPGATVASTGSKGKVGSTGIPGMTAAVVLPKVTGTPVSTNLEVLSKPSVQYTAEARQLKVQGDVILRVTFTAAGQVVVQGVVRSLGHGLDEEARRVAAQIRFRPATRNGQAVDMTTNITISFQLA